MPRIALLCPDMQATVGIATATAAAAVELSDGHKPHSHSLLPIAIHSNVHYYVVTAAYEILTMQLTDDVCLTT